jgi:uncharacterized protein (DUF1697 family)
MARARATKGRIQTYAALLRGINLGSHNKISMADLRALFEELDADDVQTYVQSGNVVFRSKLTAAELEKAVEREIENALSLHVTVLIRTKAQLAKIVRDNPFLDREKPEKALHVTFLARKPPPARVRELDPAGFEPDTFDVSGREVYLHFPNGYGRSKLSNAYFEKALDVRATTRNWRTVNALADLASA